MASGTASSLSTPHRPAPKVSTTSPHSRPSVGRLTPDAPGLDSAGSLPARASRESFASDDFAAPIVERRLTPQQQQQLSEPVEPRAGAGTTAAPMDEEPTKEDGSTLSKYIDRFRRNQPLSRGERARCGLQARPVEFWWKEPGDAAGPERKAALKPAVGVAFTSPFGDSSRQRSQVSKAAPKSRIPKLRRSPKEEEERLDSPEEVTTVTSCLAVSTDGLSTSTGASSILRPPLASIDVRRPSLDEEEEEEEEAREADLTFRPMFLGGTPDLPPAMRTTNGQTDDILAKWRLKNQMEIARCMARQVPSVPSIPAAPAVLSIPSVPSVPSFPAVPSVPSIPAAPVVPAAPSRHHFVRSTARPPAKEVRETGTQMSTPRSLLEDDAAVNTEQPAIAPNPPPPPPPPPPPTAAVHMCHCSCAAASACAAAVKKKKKKKKEKEKEKEREKEKEERRKRDLASSGPGPLELPPAAARRSPLHSGPRGASVIGEVVARGLFASGSLRSSGNSVFGVSPAPSLERDLASSVPAAGEEEEEEEDGAAALERLASREENRAVPFRDDLVLRQLRFQLHSSLEQMRLIDEQLHLRQSNA